MLNIGDIFLWKFDGDLFVDQLLDEDGLSITLASSYEPAFLGKNVGYVLDAHIIVKNNKLLEVLYG